MLRGAKHTSLKTTVARAVPLMLFFIGGKAFAMKAAEVGGVEPWPISMPVPSTTPHIKELIRRGRIVHPVYDLAGQWSLTAEALTPLCILVKWGSSEVAIRVDSQIPSLESADADMIRLGHDPRPGTIGTWTFQGVDIPLLSFLHMEQSILRAA